MRATQTAPVRPRAVSAEELRQRSDVIHCRHEGIGIGTFRDRVDVRLTALASGYVTNVHSSGDNDGVTRCLTAGVEPLTFGPHERAAEPTMGRTYESHVVYRGHGPERVLTPVHAGLEPQILVSADVRSFAMRRSGHTRCTCALPMNSFPLLSSCLFALILVSTQGCAATSLNPEAARVMVTKTPAPQGCVYVGSVVGEQGGSISGRYTSNANLAEGAFNDMKNKAFAMGANYVVIENTNAGNTVAGDSAGVSGGQTDVTHIGNAFKCADPSATVTTSGTVPAAATPAQPASPPKPGGPRAASDVVIVVL